MPFACIGYQKAYPPAAENVCFVFWWFHVYNLCCSSFYCTVHMQCICIVQYIVCRGVHLSVCLSVTRGCTVEPDECIELASGSEATLSLAYVCCSKGIRIFPKIRVLSCWTLSLTLDLTNFCFYAFPIRQCVRGQYVLGLSVIPLFIRSDLVTTISQEQLEQSRWNIFISSADDLIRPWRLKVKVIADLQGDEGFHVDAGTSKSF